MNLKAEDSLNYEIGFSASFEEAVLDQDRLAAKTTLFRNDITNLIERGANRTPYYNYDGKSQIEGIELEASYDSTYLFSRAAYTMMRGKNKKTGKSLDSIPADELVLNIGGRIPDHDMTLGWRGVFAAGQNRISGKRARSMTRGQPGPLITPPTGGYAVHDLYASWVPKKQAGGLEVRAGVDNVFDRLYREHLTDTETYAKGRTYKLSVVTQF